MDEVRSLFALVSRELCAWRCFLAFFRGPSGAGPLAGSPCEDGGTMMGVGWIDWLVCALYLVIVVALAVVSMRGQRDNDDYFIGGRRMNWWAVGVSLFATSFSSISFLGLPQRGAYQDFRFYLTILTIPLVITPILWFLFVPLYVRLRVSSGYEYLRLRFGPAAQRAGSLLYCGYALGWMGGASRSSIPSTSVRDSCWWGMTARITSTSPKASRCCAAYAGTMASRAPAPASSSRLRKDRSRC